MGRGIQPSPPGDLRYLDQFEDASAPTVKADEAEQRTEVAMEEGGAPIRRGNRGAARRNTRRRQPRRRLER